MNSRSESRFRYFAVSGFMLSPYSSSAAQVLRSALRTTVLATCSKDRTVRLWDTATCKERHRWQPHRAGLACVALSPDGKRVAAAGGKPDSKNDEGIGPTTNASENGVRLGPIARIGDLQMELLGPAHQFAHGPGGVGHIQPDDPAWMVSSPGPAVPRCKLGLADAASPLQRGQERRGIACREHPIKLFEDSFATD